MTNNLKNHEIQLYNNILLLTRNKLLYTKFNLSDTFQNRINLIFIHISFLFIKLKQTKNQKEYKEFQQRMFDLIFKKKEENMREIGYGDVSVNKKMKDFVNLFYHLVEEIEKIDLDENKNQINFLKKYLNTDKNLDFYADYFNKYRLFLTKNTLNHFTKDIINLNF